MGIEEAVAQACWAQGGWSGWSLAGRTLGEVGSQRAGWLGQRRLQAGKGLTPALPGQVHTLWQNPWQRERGQPRVGPGASCHVNGRVRPREHCRWVQAAIRHSRSSSG